MTARQKMHALAIRLQDESERKHEQGIKLLEIANDGLLWSQALLDILPKLTDKHCEEALEKCLTAEEAKEVENSGLN